MLDHIVWAVPDLAAAVRDFTARTGVEPSPGGQHLGLGTRNSLVGLTDGAYLEIIGPDPDQPVPPHRRPFGIDGRAGPRVAGWAVRVHDIEQRVARARASGHDPGDILDMQRRPPDGTVLRWRLTPLPLDLQIIPFLIDWGDSPHPATSLTQEIRLIEWRAVHPDPSKVSAALQALDVTLPVVEGPEARLVAVLETRAGRHSLGQTEALSPDADDDSCG